MRWPVARQVTALSSDDVAAALRRFRYRFVTEVQLHEAIDGALADAGMVIEREVQLSARDRIDVLVDGGIGVEVKVGGTTAAVGGQLARYAEHDRIRGLVLVTSCARHRAVPRRLNGKTVHVVSTFGAGL